MSAAVSSADTPCDTVATPRRSLRRWPFEFAFREERFFLVLSVFIGIFSALAVVCTAGLGARIAAEERLLVARYPDYADYAARTKQVVPFLL